MENLITLIAYILSLLISRFGILCDVKDKRRTYIMHFFVVFKNMLIMRKWKLKSFKNIIILCKMKKCSPSISTYAESNVIIDDSVIKNRNKRSLFWMKLKYLSLLIFFIFDFVSDNCYCKVNITTSQTFL